MTTTSKSFLVESLHFFKRVNTSLNTKTKFLSPDFVVTRKDRRPGIFNSVNRTESHFRKGSLDFDRVRGNLALATGSLGFCFLKVRCPS